MKGQLLLGDVNNTKKLLFLPVSMEKFMRHSHLFTFTDYKQHLSVGRKHKTKSLTNIIQVNGYK